MKRFACKKCQSKPLLIKCGHIFSHSRKLFSKFLQKGFLIMLRDIIGLEDFL